MKLSQKSNLVIGVGVIKYECNFHHLDESKSSCIGYYWYCADTRWRSKGEIVYSP